MPPKPKSKSICSFFIKKAATNVEPSAESGEEIEKNNLINKNNSFSEESLDYESETEISQPSKKKSRNSIIAPTFPYTPIQMKTVTKVGNVTLSSVHDTAVPILSIRARDRAPRLLSDSRIRTAESRAVAYSAASYSAASYSAATNDEEMTRYNQNNNEEYNNDCHDEYGNQNDNDRNNEYDEEYNNNCSHEEDSEIDEALPVELPIKSSMVSERKITSSNESKIKKLEYGSKKEITLRLAESNSSTGDKSLITKIVDGILRLWCRVCNVPIHANKGHTTCHLKSVCHTKGVSQIKVELNSTVLMSKALEKWRRQKPDQEGSTIGVETQLFRLETVTEFMRCGLPLSKIDGLRLYLQKYSHLQLTDQSHMRSYVTLARDMEVDRMKTSFTQSNFFTVIFDGSSRVDEVLVVILRYVTKGMMIYDLLLTQTKLSDRYFSNNCILFGDCDDNLNIKFFIYSRLRYPSRSNTLRQI